MRFAVKAVESVRSMNSGDYREESSPQVELMAAPPEPQV